MKGMKCFFGREMYIGKTKICLFMTVLESSIVEGITQASGRLQWKLLTNPQHLFSSPKLYPDFLSGMHFSPT